MLRALMGLQGAEDTENAAKSEGGVFVASDGNGVDAHFNDWIIVATWLSHVAEVEDVGFFAT